MKWVALFLFITLTACNVKPPKIDGVYTLVSAQYGDSILSKEEIAKHKTVKVLKNGYWMSATSIGNTEITVESATGGTYTVKDNKYFETINFSSENDSTIGKTYSFNYKINGDKYLCEGIMSNDKCGNCLSKEEYSKITLNKGLQDTTLEGVWKLKSSEWFGKKTEDPDLTSFKIYSYPRFAWGTYHVKGKNFIGVGGGTYRYDGKKLIEHVEYFSYYDIEPYDFEIDVTRLPPDAIRKISMNGAGKEIWEKVK